MIDEKFMTVQQNQAKIEIPMDEIATFCQRHHIRQLALFGSVLREDFGPESDLDILIEFEPEAQIGFMALSGMQLELSELFQRPVDLVPRQGLKPKIKDIILSSAQVIYAT
jgi:predicted nucleotidyltransferase